MTEADFFSPISDLNARLKKREFTAVELVRDFGERLEKLGPRYNALALPLTEVALKRAKAVDDELKRERYRGPLQGIPYGAKDLLSLADHPTTWGAKPYAAQVIDETATVLQKLDKTGSILIGKLAMVELAGGPSYGTAGASLFGPGLNPWDRTRWSGGSSSGSGSAVAAGLVPFALGSETNGSILTPSAFCGVTGLRPTYGLVSRHGAMACAWTMDKIGPMCHSAEDCGLVLQGIADNFYYTPQYSRKLSDLKIAFVDFEAVDPAFTAATQVIRDTGVQIASAAIPAFPYGALVSTIVGSEVSSVFESFITSGQVDQLADAQQIAGLKAGLEISAKDYLKAMRIRSLVKQKFRELFADIDVIIAPSRNGVAPKLSDIHGAPASALIPAGNLAGLPALSIPCGFIDSLPIGLQLVGPALAENTLLALGREFQNRTDWHKHRPPV
jgi:aspartyl-tRNA(Asn)/glutamyl-tRNA(Gln) amidotransferase subunit A